MRDVIDSMRWASALSESTSTGEAVQAAIAELRRALDGKRPDLVFAFVSPHHASQHAAIAAALADAFAGACVVGASASGVIGAGREIEERAALSLTAALLPGARVRALHVDEPLPDGGGGWRARLGIAVEEQPQFVLVVDPFSTDSEALVAGLDEAYPGAPKVGGLASGARFPGETALYLDGRLHRAGALVVALTGDVAVDTIVAQGCRAIGRPMVVTRAHDNVLVEIDRRKPGEVLQELYESLDERDQQLFRDSLFLGIEMRADQIEVNPGEYLVRNLVGMDRQSGALAIAAMPRPWQVVQFVVRDARTAAEDLSALLDRARASNAPPSGALLFSCLGRGRHLFGRADHDAGLFRERVGAVPLGGFFCNGEIGPVAGTTFLHGYTSSFALFRPR